MKQTENNIIATLVANEERKKQKKLNLWSDEELLDFIITYNIKDYKNEILKMIKKIRKEIVNVSNINKEKFTLGNEYINQLEEKGFVVVYEIPETTRNRTVHDSGIIHHVNEKVCTKGTILLHPKKSIYLVLEHIIYEDNTEELNYVKGCMVIDKNQCSEELKNASKNCIFWGFFIYELYDNKLMIDFHGESFYYCSKIIDIFFEKASDFSFPLSNSGLLLNSDDYRNLKETIDEKISNMPSQYKHYFTSDENIKYKRKNLTLHSFR